MGRIKILSDSIVSKIAAGEIVERPASVVKELVENSIDADGTSVKVELEAGGKRLIRVVDNGEGMSHDEALLSLERYSTSKISDVDDLLSVKTLGFRGEALPSISSVSRFKLITRMEKDISGTEILVEGGVIRKVNDIGCNRGTIVEARNLFFNTPPRLKFLKKTETELSNIVDVMQREAISNPQKAFELVHNSKTVFNFTSKDKINDRLGEIFPGVDFFDLSLELNGVNVTGFLSSPENVRTTTRKLYIYVNGRPLRDRFLTRIVIEAYGRHIEKGKFPQGVVFISLKAEDVDVNVHPNKNEVRFVNPGIVANVVKQAINRMLDNSPWISEYKDNYGSLRKEFHEPSKYTKYNNQYWKNDEVVPRFSDIGEKSLHERDIIADNQADDNNYYKDEKENGSEELFVKTGYFQNLNIIGQLGSLYIICGSNNGMIIIDQHAAHERINYERIKKNLLNKEHKSSQELLIPEIIELSPDELENFRRYKDKFDQLGLYVEEFGLNSIRVRSIPTLVGKIDIKSIIIDMINEYGTFDEEKSLEQNYEKVISTIACHSSIRANERLDIEKINALLKELDMTEFPHSCPHGRPVAREITFNELEKLFKRI